MGSRLVHTAAVILSLLLTPTPTTGQTQDASTPPPHTMGSPESAGGVDERWGHAARTSA